MITLCLYGESGVGKTRLAEHVFQNKGYVTLCSSRDDFQEDQGKHLFYHD